MDTKQKKNVCLFPDTQPAHIGFKSVFGVTSSATHSYDAKSTGMEVKVPQSS